jgi:hypothetical protein
MEPASLYSVCAHLHIKDIMQSNVHFDLNYSFWLLKYWNFAQDQLVLQMCTMW